MIISQTFQDKNYSLSIKIWLEGVFGCVVENCNWECEFNFKMKSKAFSLYVSDVNHDLPNENFIRNALLKVISKYKMPFHLHFITNFAEKEIYFPTQNFLRILLTQVRVEHFENQEKSFLLLHLLDSTLLNFQHFHLIEKKQNIFFFKF